jgi:hypothetical protein
MMTMPISPSVVQDLNSPQYAVREKARETLRINFHQTTLETWKELVGSLHLHKGEPASQVIIDCRAHDLPLLVLQDDGTYISQVHFDSSWSLLCSFRDGVLGDFTFSLAPPILKNDPPANFNGVWRIYREDGQRVSDDYYVNGVRAGPLSDGVMPQLPHVTDKVITNVQVEEQSGTKTDK